MIDSEVSNAQNMPPLYQQGFKDGGLYAVKKTKQFIQDALAVADSEVVKRDDAKSHDSMTLEHALGAQLALSAVLNVLNENFPE